MFRQDMFYYKFNLSFTKLCKWVGSKAVAKEKYLNFTSVVKKY